MHGPISSAHFQLWMIARFYFVNQRNDPLSWLCFYWPLLPSVFKLQFSCRIYCAPALRTGHKDAMCTDLIELILPVLLSPYLFLQPPPLLLSGRFPLALEILGMSVVLRTLWDLHNSLKASSSSLKNCLWKSSNFIIFKLSVKENPDFAFFTLSAFLTLWNYHRHNFDLAQSRDMW